MKIIDDPMVLRQISDSGIDDILLDEKYNKANLRQLIRECLKALNGQVKSVNYYKGYAEHYKSLYERLLSKMQNMIEKETEEDD